MVSKIDEKNVEVVVKILKGKFVDTLELTCKTATIDLIIVELRTNSIKDNVFLGKTSGKIIKQTNIPALIVPEGYKFIPVKNALEPLLSIKNQFNSIINLGSSLN